MYSHPQVKLDGLEDLQAYITRNERPGELDVARFRREAKQLLSTDRPWIGWIVKSAIEASQWNFDGAIEVVETAAAIFSNHAETLCNLAVTMKHMNLADRALELSARALVLEPLNSSVVSQHLVDLYALGRISEAASVARDYLRRSQNGTTTISEWSDDLEEALSAMERIGIVESWLQEECSIALEVLRDARQRWITVDLRAKEDAESGEETVYVRYSFPGDIEEEMRLGALLSERLAETPSWNPTKLSVDFTYVLVEPEDADVTA